MAKKTPANRLRYPNGDPITALSADAKPRLGRPPRNLKPSLIPPDIAVPVAIPALTPEPYNIVDPDVDRLGTDVYDMPTDVQAAWTDLESVPLIPTPPDDWKPQLGLLPAIPDRPILEMRALAVAYVLPVPPPEVHNIELDAADTGLYGNGEYGNCVFVAIEKDRVISAEALGVKITKLTAANVIAKYQEFTGITAPPGPGAVTQLVLEWIQKTSFGWGGSHLLAFGRAPLNQTGARETVSEFQSGIFSVTIHQSQEYPNRTWDQKPNDPIVGGHAIGAGTYTQLLEFAKSWGYMVSMTPAFFAGSVDEIAVLVWDFQWESLTYERQTALIADVQALTGKAWTGPQPIAPTPPVPTPTPSGYTPRTSMSTTFITPVRILDTRYPTDTPLQPGEDRRVQVTGVRIPANVVGVAGDLAVVIPTAGGWLALTPTKWVGPSSNLNFVPGQTVANGFVVGIAPDGTFSIHNGSLGTANIVVDISAFDI